ncbi:MAG: substrate-binding domain-containing protein, partial [Verrucomicrobiota bacterium]|nr:substrate-binding domain-containing protein [Verrucomicrobiota bacterium]
MNAKHAHRKTNGSSLPSLLTALALTGTLLVGCSSKQSEKQEGQITVGFSQIGAESGWRTANTQSIKSEAEKRGVDLRFSDAQGKQENQIRAIRTFIQQKVDVIAFSPVVETGWQPVLEEA